MKPPKPRTKKPPKPKISDNRPAAQKNVGNFSTKLKPIDVIPKKKKKRIGE